MSSFSARVLEVWRSSLAESMSPINGCFVFNVAPTVMVEQTLQFLRETSAQGLTDSAGNVSGFITGMRFASMEDPLNLFFAKNFCDSNELFSVTERELSLAVRELELHADINLSFSSVRYLADVGSGPALPLLVFKRVPFIRGIGFELEERDEIVKSFAVGDFNLSSKALIAQQHYSTGMALLAGEDAVSGFVDAAFMQFYLSVEALLGNKKGEAVKNGAALYGANFDSNLDLIVKRVYQARNLFFGHAHPRFLRGRLDADAAFSIAIQTLVARWCARRLLELETGRPLVKRELRLYPRPGVSILFNGDAASLDREFSLPLTD